MDELKKTLKEAATRLTETYANGLETVFYPDNGKPIPEGTILRTNIPNARFATPEEIARRNQKLAPGDEPMSNERENHFLGFARALLNEIFDEWEGNLTLGRDLYPQDNERVAQHIARRAYDLACSNVECISETMAADISVGDLTVQECVNVYVHDLTEWTE